MAEKTTDEKLLASVKALAEAYGMADYEQLTIRGAAGLLVVTGRTNFPTGFEESTRRFNFDGSPFDPSHLSVDVRREWVKKLILQGSCTQMEAAELLDVSQSTISNDLRFLREFK